MTSSPEMQSLPAHVVKMMLKALKLNSEEARLKFPRLLQLVERYTAETLDLMAKEVELWLKFTSPECGTVVLGHFEDLSFTVKVLTVAMLCLCRW